MPLVSVLMPVYNTDVAHLKQAINSILNQTFTDYELLIYNDCSTLPHVEQIVKSFSDPRIKYLKGKTNLGIAKVRNFLIDEAVGEYLAVMDHDDICLPTRFMKQIQLMQARPEIGACGTGLKRFGRMFKSNIIRYPSRDEDIRANLFFKCVMHHPSVMIRASVLKNNGIKYDESLISLNDRVLYRDISKYAKLSNISEVLCLYRLHGGMTSRTKRQQIVEEQKKVRLEYLNKMKANLTPDEIDVLNNLIMKGRAKIRCFGDLKRIENVLFKISRANQSSLYLPSKEFDKMCAQYLVKRCVNAMWYGWLNSATILKQSKLPIQDVRLPRTLKVFNFLTKGAVTI